MAQILIVDDDNAHRFILKKLLQNDGHTVIEAENGNVALEAYAQNPVDLLTTDIFMPELDGLGLIKQLKAKRQDLPVLVMTACARTDSRDYLEEAKNLGAEAVYAKPFNWQELLNHIRELTGNKKAQRSELRILVVDDNELVHDSFRSIFARQTDAEAQGEIEELFQSVFGEKPTASDSASAMPECFIDYVHQGELAVQKYKAAKNEGKPYDVVFMDVRMPPGIDGIMASSQIRAIDTHAEIVICSAYSDYAWDEIVNIVGSTEGLRFIHKPFSMEDIRQVVQRLGQGN